MLELNHIHKLYNPGTVNEICLFDDFKKIAEEMQPRSMAARDWVFQVIRTAIVRGELPGYILTRPCASSWRKASLTGIWLTLNAVDISSCLRGISPGSSPRTMAVRIT